MSRRCCCTAQGCRMRLPSRETVRLAPFYLAAGLGYLVAGLVALAVLVPLAYVLRMGLMTALAMALAMFAHWHSCTTEWTATEEFEYKWWLVASDSSTSFNHLALVGLSGMFLSLLVLACHRGRCFRLALGLLTLSLPAARSYVLDWHFFKEPRSYAVYPVPRDCNSSAADSGGTHAWVGVDGAKHCTQLLDFNVAADSLYYIATARTEFEPSCFAFAADSAALELWDCEERLGEAMCRAVNPWGVDECTRLSWVLGWKLGRLLQWVAVVRLIADACFSAILIDIGEMKSSMILWIIIIFVCTELYQLAVSLPAIIFYHGPCLHLTLPSFVSLESVRDGVLVLGSATQFSLEILILLALLGLFLLVAGIGICIVAVVIFGLLRVIELLAFCAKCGDGKKVATCWAYCEAAFGMAKRVCRFLYLRLLALWAIGTAFIFLAACPYGCVALVVTLLPSDLPLEGRLIGLVLASNLLIKYPLMSGALKLCPPAPRPLASERPTRSRQFASRQGGDFRRLPVEDWEKIYSRFYAAAALRDFEEDPLLEEMWKPLLPSEATAPQPVQIGASIRLRL